MEGLAIGIDLGTTNTSVGCYKNGIVEILENSDGGRLTPSCVFFLKKAEALAIVGKCAKRMTDMLPSNGIYEIKRFVGRGFDSVKESLNYFSFDVENKSDNPVIKIERDSEILTLTPQEVCTLILKQVKKDVEAKLEHVVDKAVITVPAYFNTTQREVTLKAANEAGFTVLKLFNEPTAAALSYYFKNEDESDCYSLVYDLGGGTFDVSILKRNSNKIDIICVDGDTNLGGKDFDNLIIDYVCERLKTEYDYDLKEDRREIRRLQNICECAKVDLSTAVETSIILHGFVHNHRMIEIELKRDDFELKACTLIDKTLNIVDRCLQSSKLRKDQIKDVILSGGSSRIPKIQEMLSRYFDGKSLSKFAHLDECVAEGAALQAAMLTNNPRQEIRKLVMTDVVPLSLGVRVFPKKMKFILKKNSSIPTSNSIILFTSEDRQTELDFDIFEGERLNVKQNHYLGTLSLKNITPAPPRQAEVRITMSIDHNGVLKLEAAEQKKNNMKELKFIYTRGFRSDHEIKQALSEAELTKEEDKLYEAHADLCLYLHRYCTGVKYNLSILKLKEKYETIYKLCESTQNEVMLLDVDDKSRLEDLKDKIEKECETFVKSHNIKIIT